MERRGCVGDQDSSKMAVLVKVAVVASLEYDGTTLNLVG